MIDYYKLNIKEVRKIKTTLFFVTLIFFFSNPLHGQVPGYQGKKFSLNWDMNITPSFRESYSDPLRDNPSYNTDLEFGNFHLEIRNNFSLDFVVGRTISIGSNIGFFKTGFGYYSYEGFDGYEINKSQISGQTIGIYFKNFDYENAGSIAPIGEYHKWEILFIPYKVVYSMKPNELSTTKKDSTVSFNSSTFAITYQKGYQAIYFNRIITNFGYQFGLVPSGMMAVRESGTSIYPGEREALYRMFNLFFINFNLGFGVLIR